MSVLPSSRKRPSIASAPRLASIAAPDSEFSTTSTPAPPVAARVSSANASERESMTWAMPCSRSHARFSGRPAVAKTSAPRWRAISTAAMPVPPVAEWMSMRSPRPSRARCTRLYHTVVNTAGTAAACTAVSPAGRGATRRASVMTWLAKLPAAIATTSWPTASPLDAGADRGDAAGQLAAERHRPVAEPRGRSPWRSSRR